LGRPKDFVITIRDIKISAGAGFIVPLAGSVMTMPGLPKSRKLRKLAWMKREMFRDCWDKDKGC